jgi:hypothetical protein
VSPEFANGVSLRLQEALRGRGGSIYPRGMYFFIIAEAASGREKRAAAEKLLSRQRDGSLRRLSEL